MMDSIQHTNWRTLPWLLVVVLAWLSYQQTRVWSNELTLWAHAVERAPFKPRPAVRLGMALMATGHLVDGQAWMAHAKTLRAQPHLPAWER